MKFHDIDRSAWWTALGIIALFSLAVAVVLIAPRHIDETWTSPSSHFQVEMYEKYDPCSYLSISKRLGEAPRYVHHLHQGHSLLVFQESEKVAIDAPAELQRYVTKKGEKKKMTDRLLFLKAKEKEGEFELYDPGVEEAFALDPVGGILPDCTADEEMDEVPVGTVYLCNPQEFKVVYEEGGKWHYDPKGEVVKSVEQLQAAPLEFRCRKDLIEQGESLYAIEGCWYCHTDQTRTLIEDVVLNGTDLFPAPPSSANEFIYQKITFPGTRRIGPDLSRVGVKRASRDWHRDHFLNPQQTVPGTIMPSFAHFFNEDAEGNAVPNWKFEAIYQYMMTKGTRITAPSQAWWLGKDPIDTKKMINSR